MKQILYSDWLISIIPKACIFDNYEELQLYAIVLSHWETKFNKLKWLIDSSIKLNNNNWNIIVEWNIIWTINLDNLPWKFFKYLFDYKWIYRSHEDIINEINPWTRSKTYGAQCSEIKSDLSKSIKNLIKSKKWYYIIK
jgi:hypothetical protein